VKNILKFDFKLLMGILSNFGQTIFHNRLGIIYIIKRNHESKYSKLPEQRALLGPNRTLALLAAVMRLSKTFKQVLPVVERPFFQILEGVRTFQGEQPQRGYQ